MRVKSLRLAQVLNIFNAVMLVTSEPNSGPPSRTPSILDSPTLARVERARLRLEASKQQQQQQQQVGNGGSIGGVGGKREDSLERSILDPKVSGDVIDTYVCVVTRRFKVVYLP